MTRPILWAGAALIVLAVWGASSATRIARRIGTPSPPPAAALAAQPDPFADRLLVVNSDLSGHYTIHPTIDGQRVRMMVDTGATTIALTAEDAAAAGYRPEPKDFSGRVSTANGLVAVAPIRIREIRVGDITVRDVEGVVVPSGRLGTSLLGMSFLRRLKGFEVSAGRLTMRG